MCWRWDKKWEFSRGDTELCFAFVITSCQARSAGDARWNTRLNSGKQTPGWQRDLQLICIKIAPDHVWGEEGTQWSDSQREDSQKQHSTPTNCSREHGKHHKNDNARSWDSNCRDRGLCNDKGIQTVREEWRTHQNYLWESTEQRQWYLIKKSYFRLPEAVFSS